MPDYLAQYFAAKINTKILQENGLITIPVDRSTYLGKTILRSIEIDSSQATQKKEGNCSLRVSNYAGNNFYSQTPMGTRHFLTINPDTMNKIVDLIKMDFDDALISFVRGAEYAHTQNGWLPSQKRRGIRKAAILEFCARYEISPDQRNLESLVKMYQRRKRRARTSSEDGIKKYAQVLSF